MSLVVLRIVTLAALVSPLPAHASGLPLPQESSALRATMVEQVSPAISLSAAATIDQAGLLPAGAFANTAPLGSASVLAASNSLLIEVQGLDNNTSVTQTGVLDTAIITQNGTGNIANVSQSADGSFARVSQTGINNVAIIIQGR